MIVSEEEAKKKFCPTICDPETGPVFCEGSGCMAWRWHSVTLHHEEPVESVEVKRTGKGYCGLAGRPE